MRSLGTIIGVAAVIAIVIVGNSTYQMYTDADKFGEAIRGIIVYMEDGIRQHARWDDFAQTQGSFDDGAQFADAVAEMEGTRIYLAGFGIPLDQGRFDVRADVTSILPALMMGAKQKTVYRFQSRFLLAPLPPQCYAWESPPVNQTIFVVLEGGTSVDIEPEVPLYLSGVLELRREPGRFFYVLRDAKSEDIPAAR